MATINQIHWLGLLVGALSSFFWTVAYALIIRQGAKDRTFGMPLTALGANLAWESIFLFETLRHSVYDARLAMILPWTLLDGAIVYQCFRFGADDFHTPTAKQYFRPGLLGILLIAAIILYSFVREFRDAIGWYAAFGQNLMMSILFVTMILRRNSLHGQSIYIAISKFLGTFFAFLLALFWSPRSLHEHWETLLPDKYYPISNLLIILYAGIFLFDVLYIVLVVQKRRADGTARAAPEVASLQV